MHAAAAGFFASHAAVFVTISGGQCLGGDFFDGLLHLTGRVSGSRIDVHRNRTVKIESVCRFRAEHLLQRDELAYGSHLRPIAHEHVVQCMLVEPELRRSLHHHPVNLAILVVVRYISAAAVAVQHIEHRGGRYTCTLAFGGIHLYRQLREIHGIRGIGHRYFRTLVQCAEKLHHILIKHRFLSTRLVLHVQFHRVTHTVARYHTHLETEYLCLLDALEPCVEACHYGIGRMLLAFALAPIFKAYHNHTVRSALSGPQSIAGHFGVVLHFGHIL